MAKKDEVKYPLHGTCPEGHNVTSEVNGAGYCDRCQKGDAHDGPAPSRKEDKGIKEDE